MGISIADMLEDEDTNTQEVRQETPNEQKTPVVEQKSTRRPVKEAKSTSAGINIPLYQSTNIPEQQGVMIAAIHKALRDKSNDAASYRLSKIEKQRLTVVLHELKIGSLLNPDQLNLSSNENEVARIALNYLLNDYQEHKDNSILVRVLTSLRS
jgi:hypothetical protein